MYTLSSWRSRHRHLRQWSLVSLSFDIYLRPSEALGIRGLDIAFDKNCYSVVINLGFTKAGQRRGRQETVTCRNSTLVYMAKLIVEELAPGDYIYNRKTYRYRKEFYDLLHKIGVEKLHFKPYSLRRGGATAAFRGGASWETIAEIGRWGAHQTMRLYIVDAMAELTGYNIPEHVDRQLLEAAKSLKQLLSS